MKQEISFNMFCDAFSESRENTFSYDGKLALFDYLEELDNDCGTETDLDIIAICCEYSEYEDIEEYLKDYNTDVDKKEFENDLEGYEEKIMEELQNQTTVILIDKTDGFIIRCY